MFKASIIGCGKIAGSDSASIETHIGAIVSNKKIKLASCYDNDDKKAKIFANKYNCLNEKSITDLLLITQPDIISICTPDKTHFSIIKQVLKKSKKKKVIFVEKPVCTDEVDYKSLLNISKNTNAKILINHTRRFDQGHQELKELIKRNKFGKLIQSHATYYSGWLHNGIHIIDTLNFLFEGGFKLNKIIKYSKSKYPNDPTIDLKIELKKFKSPVKISSFEEKFYQLLEIDLLFERSRIKIENFGKEIKFEKKIVNEIGENTLIKYSPLKKTKFTPMQNAYMQIEKYLASCSDKYIKNFLLEESILSMNFMWKVKNKLKNREKTNKNKKR